MRKIPPLRSELNIEPEPSREDVPFVVNDYGLNRRIRLDEIGAFVAEHLDREQTLAELAKRLDTQEPNVERAVAFFETYHLLDTEESRAMVRDAKATQAILEMSPEEVPLLIREDARFSCTMCGSCCGGTNIGPVSDDVLKGLEPHLEALQRKTRATSGLFFTIPSEKGATQHTLCRQTRGSCVFLNDDDLCTIHSDYGGEAKPDDCRLFPWMFVATPKGIAVSLQMECRGFNEARQGKRFADQIPEIRKILALAQGVSRSPPRVPAIITVTGRLTMTYERYQVLEEELHAIIDREGKDPARALIGMRDAIFQATGLESDASVSRKQSLKTLLERVLGSIHTQLEEIRENMVSADPNLEIHTETLEQVEHALETFTADIVRVFAVPDRRAQRELFQEKAHHYLQQQELVTFDSVLQGFTYLAFQWLLSQSLSIHRAREMKRRHVTEQDLMDAFTVISLVWRTEQFQEILGDLDDELTTLFMDQLHQIADDPEFFQEPDLKGHLYKF